MGERYASVAERYVEGNLALHCHFGLVGSTDDTPAKGLCAFINRAEGVLDFDVFRRRASNMSGSSLAAFLLGEGNGGIDDLVFVDVVENRQTAECGPAPVLVRSQVGLQFLDQC